MTNHVHLLVTPMHHDFVSRVMQYLGRLYVRYFNDSFARTGTLFEGRFRSSQVREDEHFLACLRYIELNPVRAGMVSEPGEYRWSSYRAHGHGVRIRLWEPHADYLSRGDNAISRQQAYRGLMSELLDLDVMAKIRHCANTGLVLGTEKFRKQVAVMVE